MQKLVLGILLVMPCAALVGCFQFDEPVCSFSCTPGAGAEACPEDYECRSDGYCHRHDSTEVCPFTDASVLPDLSAAIPDLSNADGGPVDASPDGI